MAKEAKKSVFETLNAINVNDHTESKNNLTYLSWAWAWGEVKNVYPDAFYTIYERENGIPYFTDGKTCWVKTGVTIDGLEHIEYLPIMDYKNASIPLERVTSFDMNKAIQRSLTKACARHGLGLYIYAGEDLPEEEKKEKQRAVAEANKKACDDLMAAINNAERIKVLEDIWNTNSAFINANKEFLYAWTNRKALLERKVAASTALSKCKTADEVDMFLEEYADLNGNDKFIAYVNDYKSKLPA